MRRALATLTTIGAGCVVAGVYLWFGIAAALIVGGLAAVSAGLLVDDGAEVRR